METVHCYKQSMLDFLHDFDPLKHKYHVFPNWNYYPPFVTSNGAQYDATLQFDSFTKKNFSGILGNLSLVYGNSGVVQKDIETYFLTEKEIILRYLNLPMISSMFDEDYFEFEWDMHVGQNFAEHRSDYYRDHFIHQVRNMYMMHELLNKWFYKGALDALSDSKTGRISQYVCVKFRQFMQNKYAPEFLLCQENANSIQNFRKEDDKLPDIIKNFRPRYLPNKQNIKEILTEDYAFHYFFKYVIYASAYLSALFHDMGYPICHFLGIRSRISEYNPALYMITQNITGSIDNIFSKLGDSLLFTIISHEEIKSRMKRKANGQYDHGLYSALTFLLHFYETDAIQSLSPEKRCSVELAALAIYNHTMAYACAEKPEKAKDLNYYQPVFRQNPVSFLLHFCDDLEEWDRRYFEISDASALSVCSYCHGVLMPHKLPVSQNANIDKEKGNSNNMLYHPERYSAEWGENISPIEVFDCFCTKGSQKHICFRRQTFFKRQIYLVTTAPKVTFSVNFEKSTLHAEVHYDLFRLLQMSHINNTYAKFRLKDLRELKCRTYGQQYMSQCNEFPFDNIFVDAFMTANPILIKVKMLERVQNKKSVPVDTNLRNELREYLTRKKGNVSDAINNMEAIAKPNTVQINQSLEEYLFKPVISPSFARIDFYLALLKMSRNAREEKDQWKDISTNTQYLDFTKTWLNTSDEFYNRVLGELVYDCVHQYRNEPNPAKDTDVDYYMSKGNEKTYKSIYEPDSDRSDTLYDAILKYCNDRNSFNQYFNDSDDMYIGYFGDLFFFEVLNDLLYE